MNDTQEAPPAGSADDRFDARRLRTIKDMRRTRDDRLLGGVCAGAARYLNIDPVVIRVVVAVLTFVGFAGLILYAAAWFLIPAEDAERSVAADWFNLDKNEEQIRVVGLALAGVLAAVAVVGDKGYAWWGVPWFLIPLAALYYVFVVRPRRRAAERAAAMGWQPPPPPGTPAAVAGQPAASGVVTPPSPSPYGVPGSPYPPPPRRQRRSWALTLLTLAVTAIVIGAVRIYDEVEKNVPGSAYVAAALGVVALGLLVGTLWGHGGPLIAVGIVLSVALAVGSALPSGRLGAQHPTPATASEVESRYVHGMGLLELDLTAVENPGLLVGRTVELESGVGQTKVVVPDGLAVRVQARLGAGQIKVFDRQVDGTDNELTVGSAAGPVLTIDIHQRLGNIEVIRR